jgi:hypothetical protein
MSQPQCSICTWEYESARTVNTSMSARAWGEEIGVAHTTITRHLGHAPTVEPPAPAPVEANYKWEQGADDFAGNSPASTVPLTEDDVQAFMRKKGLNPDEWESAWRFSEWEAQQKGGNIVVLHAFRVSGKRKGVVPGGERLVSTAEVLEAIRTFTYIPEAVAHQDQSLVIVPTDFQFGKVDWNGGSKETLEQVLHSFAKAAEFAKEFRPAEIAIVDAGDIVENIYNTSSQLGTNDRDLPHQIVEAAFAMQKGLQMLAPCAPSIRYAAVSSNHGAMRLGPKAPGGDAHADYGIAIAKMLGNALTLNPEAFGHVTVQVPQPYMESLYFRTSGSDIGVVHSHQAGNVAKIGEWWKGQSHGNMPTSAARILIAGHWHSLKVEQSGDARWIFVGPSSDRGSSWFTNLRGEQSQSGMLTFTTADNTWSNLVVR